MHNTERECLLDANQSCNHEIVVEEKLRLGDSAARQSQNDRNCGNYQGKASGGDDYMAQVIMRVSTLVCVPRGKVSSHGRDVEWCQ